MSAQSTRRRARTVSALSALLPLALLATGCDLLPKRSLGESLWRERCSECHGLDGSGNTPRYMGDYKADLRDDSWQHGAQPEAWEVVIRRGIFGVMPANPDLTREQVAALVHYLRELRGEAQPARASG